VGKIREEDLRKIHEMILEMESFMSLNRNRNINANRRNVGKLGVGVGGGKNIWWFFGEILIYCWILELLT
jgi:hypothetical protein